MFEARSRGFTGLYGAAFFGCVEMVITLLENVWATDLNGSTIIAWVVRRGQEGVVGILWGQNDVNPDTADTLLGQTPECCSTFFRLF